MMGIIWQHGQFSWAFVASVMYMVLVLLGSDYVWRISRLGGRRVAMLAGAGAILGITVILGLWS